MWGGAVRGVCGVAGEPPAGARCRAGFADAAAGKELDVSGARAQLAAWARWLVRSEAKNLERYLFTWWPIYSLDC